MDFNFSGIKSIFFENKTIRQTIFKNTFWIGLSSGISKILKLILIIYVARIFGATEYGKFTFALSFVSLFVVFFDLGLSNIVTREFSREQEREKELFSILSLKVILSLGTIILIFLISFFITPDPTIRKVIWILAVFSAMGNFSEIIYAFLRARQKMEYEAWSIILEALIVMSVGFFIILTIPSIINLSYSYLLSSLVSLVFISTFLHFKIFRLKISWEKEIWKKFLLISWPLALSSLFGAIYAYIDSVMMGYWKQITETGWYNAADRIITVTTIPLGIISMSFYPVLSKFFKKSEKDFQKVWNYNLELMIILAFPLIIGGFVFASRIINFIYGQGFTPSILAFQILIFMAGILFISNPFGQIFIISNQQKKYFFITVFGALINIILNLILIPKFSLYGAAVSTVITNFLVLLLLLKFAFQFCSIKLLNLEISLSFLVAVFSAFIMYFVISRPAIYYLNIFLSSIIGVITYLAVFFILKFIIKRFRYINF